MYSGSILKQAHYFQLRDIKKKSYKKQLSARTRTHTYTHSYIVFVIDFCMCVCVCLCVAIGDILFGSYLYEFKTIVLPFKLRIILKTTTEFGNKIIAAQYRGRFVQLFIIYTFFFSSLHQN